ncbi:MAG: response regulator [bacterium]|nr:response regulator [bacterium]
MLKVLICDDDLITRKLLSRTVESLGHTAINASSGKKAWDILMDNSDISLLITDIAMPDLDGRELIKTIRGNESVAKLPIIIVSGVVGYNEIREILELGASRFMPKPLDLSELKKYIEALIVGKESLGSA